MSGHAAQIPTPIDYSVVDSMDNFLFAESTKYVSLDVEEGLIDYWEDEVKIDQKLFHRDSMAFNYALTKNIH